jgi:peptidyl-prolyl cis-trans isomerase B (cyclophilin B)
MPGIRTGLCQSCPVRVGAAQRSSSRIVAALVGLLLVLLAGCGRIPPTPTPTPTATDSSFGDDLAPGECEYAVAGEPAKPVDLPPTSDVATSGTTRYVLEMTEGPVAITLDQGKAPCTVNSFVSLARQGYFDGTRCHRLADSGIFLLQCGDPTGTGRGGPGYQFANETDGTESYVRGVVAMANAGPDTNGSQFFLVWDDSTSLDSRPNYTIFGTLDPASRDVVASMAAEGQDGSGGDGTGRPNNPSEIIRATPA